MKETPLTVTMIAIFKDSKEVEKLVAMQPTIHQPQPTIKISLQPHVKGRKWPKDIYPNIPDLNVALSQTKGYNPLLEKLETASYEGWKNI